MKALKYIIISIVILLLIFVGFGYMQDKEVSVSRSIVIKAPISMVFDQFNDIEKRVKWSPWEQNDSTMVTKFGDKVKGSGASYSWTSENSGNGEILYTEVVENQLIQSELRFGPDEENPGQGLMIFSPVADGIQVTWEMHTNMGNNPFMRLMGRYMDDIVGPTFEQGLDNVKEICENEANQAQFLIDNYTPEIAEIEVVGKPCISILDSCSIDEMEARFEAHYGELNAFIEQGNYTISGFPRTIYHKWEPPTKVVFEPLFVLETGAPVTMGTHIISGTTYSGKVITATHLGSYESSARVWEGLDKYMNEHNFEPNGSPWEQYENTPRDEPDPNKLITHIFMPVK